MKTLSYSWRAGDAEHELRLVPVPGTAGKAYLFGADPHRIPVEIRDFHMASTPVTQALWTHVMGSNPARRVDPRAPVENVSWDQIAGTDGFLERINSSPILTAVAGSDRALRFRVPSETEWEYAARGGPHWADGFRFSGSNDVDAVAWYGPKWSAPFQLATQLFGWRIGWRVLGRLRVIATRPRHTHDVATKAPNQLGLYDMSGNVWEWCEDTYSEDDVQAPPPRDGTPLRGAGDGRRLRGGCHTNWDLHCTVWWRYGIHRDAHDGCIGVRIALAPA